MSIKQVFVINGNAGVGKDTFVKNVKELFLNEKTTRYEKFPTTVMNYSSVHKVKQIAETIGWDGIKDEKGRKLLSDLKDLLTWYNDTPFKCMKEKVEEFHKNKSAKILFLHIREPEEIERAKKEFNAKTILIKRDSIKHITSNSGDAGVFNYDYDIVIDNNGNHLDYSMKTIDFVNDLINGKLKSNY